MPIELVNDEDILRAQEGDEESITLILENYKNFIFMNTRNYFLIGADQDDILQEGMLGLVKAIYAYDTTREATFKTFATICIKRHLITAIKATNTQKNRVLNSASSNSFETEEGKEIPYAKSLATQELLNPEDLYLAKEKLEKLTEYGEKHFSKFEKEIFELIVKGYKYREISEMLNRDLKTIDNTIQRIKRKSEQWMMNY